MPLPSKLITTMTLCRIIHRVKLLLLTLVTRSQVLWLQKTHKNCRICCVCWWTRITMIWPLWDGINNHRIQKAPILSVNSLLTVWTMFSCILYHSLWCLISMEILLLTYFTKTKTRMWSSLFAIRVKKSMEFSLTRISLILMWFLQVRTLTVAIPAQQIW